MKKLTICLCLLAFQTQADVILSAVVKNGPNGYTATASTNTSTTQSVPPKHDKDDVNTGSVTTTNVDVMNRVQSDLGLRLEYMSKESPIVVSIEGFQDTTVAASIGVRLW